MAGLGFGSGRYVPQHARPRGPVHRIRSVPGNGRSRVRQVAAGAAGAALITSAQVGYMLPGVASAATAVAASGSSTTGSGLSVSASSADSSTQQGYDLIGGDGGVFNFRTGYYGSEAGHRLGGPVVGAASTPDGQGYWLVGSDGGVFTFGNAAFYGSMAGRRLAAPIVAMAASPDGRGYALLGADGGVFAFGHAWFWGNTLGLTKSPAAGIAFTPDGGGYWIVTRDGTVWSFGNAPVVQSGFTTNTGRSSVDRFDLFKYATGIAPTPSGHGYWVVAADGGVFAYGDARFYGSTGGLAPNTVAGILPTPTGNGYWLARSDGYVYDFGDAGALGNLSGQHLGASITAITGRLFGPTLSGVLPAGVINQPYSAQLYAGGGVKPYTFSVTGLPNGLSVDPKSGLISGTPAEVGHYSVTATVTDAGGRHATKVLSLDIAYPPIQVHYPNALYVGVSTDTNQGGQNGDDTPTVTGGDGGPYTASLAGGTSLTPGLVLESDGTVRGDPAAPGGFDLRFTDGHGDGMTVHVPVTFAPTGIIAALAGGLQNTGTDVYGQSAYYGQTTLPARDANTVAPTSDYPTADGGEGGPSTGAQILTPEDVAVGPDGNTYMSEVETGSSGQFTGNGDVRAIGPDGIIHTVAGGPNATTADPNGVPAADGKLQSPDYVGVDSAGDVFIGDVTPKVIYEIPAKDGIYHGNDTAWTAGDIYPVVDLATSSGTLAGMTVAPGGTLYWSNSTTHEIDSLAPTSSTPAPVVTTSTTAASGAQSLGTPGVLAFDPPTGDLYLANHCSTCASVNSVSYDVVESFDPTAGANGTLTDVTGGQQFGVQGLTVDSAGNLYISDYASYGAGTKVIDDEILRVAPGSNTPVVVAGKPPTGSSGPGGFTSAGYQNGVDAQTTGIDAPNGIAYNPQTGNLTIAQAPTEAIGGVGAKAVRIVSDIEHVKGSTYTPGGAPPLA